MLRGILRKFLENKTSIAKQEAAAWRCGDYRRVQEAEENDNGNRLIGLCVWSTTWKEHFQELLGSQEDNRLDEVRENNEEIASRRNKHGGVCRGSKQTLRTQLSNNERPARRIVMVRLMANLLDKQSRQSNRKQEYKDKKELSSGDGPACQTATASRQQSNRKQGYKTDDEAIQQQETCSTDRDRRPRYSLRYGLIDSKPTLQTASAPIYLFLLFGKRQTCLIDSVSSPTTNKDRRWRTELSNNEGPARESGMAPTKKTGSQNEKNDNQRKKAKNLTKDDLELLREAVTEDW
ncbi:hypothetical protein ILUMI_27117 [Ignelater luminosus]|uniref:Uncharacterized protein n=1 Tax=Ignelater luminosus TaxID=2038154 RepID=A0A8K0C3Q3_IGNLU|nr:hypothetical protein ILUMI_27117 [Ignelater luminosus]